MLTLNHAFGDPVFETFKMYVLDGSQTLAKTDQRVIAGNVRLKAYSTNFFLLAD